MQTQRFAQPRDEAALARQIAAAAPRVDSAAEAELYRSLAPRVRLYGLRHLRDPHAAADLVQQVLVMTLERLRDGKIREPDKLASFVLGTCRMVVLEIRRGAARRARLLDAYGDRIQSVEFTEPRALDEKMLARCLSALPERERSVLILSFYADKPADEVARELGISPGNVRVIRHRALTRLRQCIEESGTAP